MEDPKFYTPEKIVTNFDISNLKPQNSNPTEWQPKPAFEVEN